MGKKKAEEHSPNYENLKTQYDKGYISKQTLRGYVQIYSVMPQVGITPEEYEEITGEKYE